MLTLPEMLGWLVASSALATALPLADSGVYSTYVVHEAKTTRNAGMWKRGQAADGDIVIPLRIGLAQNNLDLGYERLMEVSHPASARYGQHLRPDEVHSLFAPAPDTVSAVKDWLIASGIAEPHIVEYENKGWLSVDLPLRDIEQLLQTQYYEHEHESEDGIRVGCDEYSIPRHLSQHIDYIKPGLLLSGPIKKRSTMQKRAVARHRGRYGMRISDDTSDTDSSSSGDDVLCSQVFTVACYRKLYNIPANNTALPGNSVGLFEIGDTYSQQDLDLSYARFAPYVPSGTAPIQASIDGGLLPVADNSSFNGAEPEIDIQIIQPLVYPQNITLFQTDDAKYSSGDYGSYNSFLDALDGSYCTRKAFGIKGGDPTYDPTYPDPTKGGYKGDLMCGTYAPTRVVSVSYGFTEFENPSHRYAQRQCSEFMKLGLQGTTFLISSGDWGIADHGSPDEPSAGCITTGELAEEAPQYVSAVDTSKNQTILFSGWPSDCPWVTAVGGTMLPTNASDSDPEVAMQVSLDPQGNSFSSSGGFSNFFPAPEYQRSTIAGYFASNDPGFPSYEVNRNATNIGANGGMYNRAGRGFPDVSANGVGFGAFVGGQDGGFQGTSLSAPMWASIITLINQERQAVGKGPVGFINPVLYANPQVFVDITKGSNPNCNLPGYEAVEGWDPVTGLGTPNYPELLKLFLSLP